MAHQHILDRISGGDEAKSRKYGRSNEVEIWLTGDQHKAHCGLGHLAQFEHKGRDPRREFTWLPSPDGPRIRTFGQAGTS